jgi:hypothetical protein
LISELVIPHHILETNRCFLIHQVEWCCPVCCGGNAKRIIKKSGDDGDVTPDQGEKPSSRKDIGNEKANSRKSKAKAESPIENSSSISARLSEEDAELLVELDRWTVEVIFVDLP